MVLEDHYTGDEINGALNRGEAFTGAFPGETEDELDALRELFHRKALVARQARLCEALMAGGATPEEVTARRVADLPRRARRASLPRAARAARHPGRRRRAGVRPARRRADHGGRADPLAADGAARADEPRGQRRHLPLAAGSPLRHPTTPRRWRRHEGGPAARVPRGAQARQRRRAQGRRAVRRDREDRRGRAVPHRPAHPGGAVGREVRGRAALHARARERGLGPRDRLRRHQRRGRRHGDRAPVHLLRAVPPVPARRRHALRQRLVPRASTATAASPSCCRPARARWSSSTRRSSPDHRRARRRRADRDPRRQEGDPGARRRAPRSS